MSYDLTAMTRDEVIIDLVRGGMSLNKATKHYVELKRAAGMTVGVVSHKEEALAWLAEADLSSPINPKPLVDGLVMTFGVKTDTAMNYIRMYADEAGMEVKTRLASSEILDWIVYNAPEDDGDWTEFDESFKAWMKSMGKSESNINEYRKGIKLHLMLIRR